MQFNLSKAILHFLIFILSLAGLLIIITLITANEGQKEEELYIPTSEPVNESTAFDESKIKLSPNCNSFSPNPPLNSGIADLETLIYRLRVGRLPKPYSEDNLIKCYNDVVNQSLEAKYDPGFVIAVWLEKSGASFYQRYPNIHDFGCSDKPTEDFQTQLACFLSLKQNFQDNFYKNCLATANKPNTEEFLLLFQEGLESCNPTSDCYHQFCSDSEYLQRLKHYYKIITQKELPTAI